MQINIAIIIYHYSCDLLNYFLSLVYHVLNFLPLYHIIFQTTITKQANPSIQYFLHS